MTLLALFLPCFGRYHLAIHIGDNTSDSSSAPSSSVVRKLADSVSIACWVQRRLYKKSAV